MVTTAEHHDVEAYRLMRAGRFADALPLAERAVAMSGKCLPAHAMLASILAQLGRADEADAVVQHAWGLDTGSADAYDGLAFVSIGLGQHERATRLYRRATELEPDTPRFWYNLACGERSVGRLEQAELACDRAIALDAGQFPSYLLRSELRVQTAAQNHVDELRRQLARPGRDGRTTFFLGFALGKELDDLQRYDEAFAWFSAAAGARRSLLKYEVASDERKMQRIRDVFSAAAVAGAVTGAPARGVRHVFIIGLPRSGTTLVERVLTGLAGTRSNGETAHFSKSLLSATPAGEGDIFQRAALADPAVVRANYERLANPRGAFGTIIEKLPMNYLYVGAIRRALPDAKILWVRRSALDSCFAMYRTLFGAAYPFSYDFLELARYYAAYERLMEHWRLLGADMVEIVYEDLVAEPRQVGAAIARHCNLVWSDEALEIQKNATVSLTASASQVRRPIYGTSSGRWRRYHRHLGDLIGALRRAGIVLPPDA